VKCAALYLTNRTLRNPGCGTQAEIDEKLLVTSRRRCCGIGGGVMMAVERDANQIGVKLFQLVVGAIKGE
jgi:hypothetical protein